MKKISLVLACSALCAAAFAEADTITTASANTFGAVKIVSKVTGADNYTYVAVPFEEFPATGVEASSKNRLYNDIIIPGLCSGSTMSIYGGNDVWWGYVAGDASWTSASAGAGNGGATSASPAPGSNYADVGTGVFWNPGTMTGQGYVYSYGQVPTGYTKTVSLPAGKTLVCPPGANALKEFDLNAATWGDGVTASELRLTGTNVRKVLKVGDMIQFRHPETGVMKQLYYATVPGGENGEKKWGAVSIMKPFDLTAAKIPAGTAFWYVSKGNASVTWP